MFLMMAKSHRDCPSQGLIMRTVLAFLFATALSGVEAEIWRDTCPGEETELFCPLPDWAIQNDECKELRWSVSDPNNANAKQSIVYCGENLVNCIREPLEGGIAQRIKIRNPARGKVFLTQLLRNERLTYTCEIQLKENNPVPLVHHVNVSSSVYCRTVHTGQDLNFSRGLVDMVPQAAIQDMWWYIILPSGKKQTIVYCNSSSCLFNNCYKSCPESLSTFKMEGMSLILRNVKQSDRGLTLQCRIELNVIVEKAAKPQPRVYTVKIKDVLELPSSAGSNKTYPSAVTKTPARNGTGRTLGTQTSAAGKVLEFTVLMCLVFVTLF